MNVLSPRVPYIPVAHGINGVFTHYPPTPSRKLMTPRAGTDLHCISCPSASRVLGTSTRSPLLRWLTLRGFGFFATSGIGVDLIPGADGRDLIYLTSCSC